MRKRLIISSAFSISFTDSFLLSIVLTAGPNCPHQKLISRQSHFYVKTRILYTLYNHLQTNTIATTTSNAAIPFPIRLHVIAINSFVIVISYSITNNFLYKNSRLFLVSCVVFTCIDNFLTVILVPS